MRVEVGVVCKQAQSFGGDGNVLKLDFGDGAQDHKFTKNQSLKKSLVHLKWINVMVCKLYLSKAALTITLQISLIYFVIFIIVSRDGMVHRAAVQGEIL